MLTTVPQQDAGHLDQPQVVGGLLLVAYQDGAALRQPAQRALHYPSSSWASSSLKSGTFAPAITAARGSPSASTRRERFTPFFPLSVGLGPIWSPQTSLAHSAVRGLPLKVHPTELLAVLDETLPDEIQHAKLDPSLEGPVYRGVVGKLFGQSVPLDPASHPEDDRVQSGTLVHARAAGALGRILLV